MPGRHAACSVTLRLYTPPPFHLGPTYSPLLLKQHPADPRAAFDDVWMDTRGTLTPILPKKPYPVMRVPPPVAAGGRSGRRSTGTSCTGSGWSGTSAASAHDDKDLPASLRDSPDEGRACLYLHQQQQQPFPRDNPTAAARSPLGDVIGGELHEHLVEHRRASGRGHPAASPVSSCREDAAEGSISMDSSAPGRRGVGSTTFGWLWRASAAGAGARASSSREPLLSCLQTGGDKEVQEGGEDSDSQAQRAGRDA